MKTSIDCRYGEKSSSYHIEIGMMGTTTTAAAE
jgi:hypothetical protein